MVKKLLKKLFKKLIPATIVTTVLLATLVSAALADATVQDGPWTLSWACNATSVSVAFPANNWPVHAGDIYYADGTADIQDYEWTNGQHNSPYSYGGKGVAIVMIALWSHPDTGGSDYEVGPFIYFPVECKPKVHKVWMWLYDPGTVVDGFACLVVNDTPTVPAPHRVEKVCGDFFADQGYDGYVATASVCGGPVTRNGWACDYFGYSRFGYVRLLRVANRQPGDW